MERWGPFSWTTGELVWVVLAVVVGVVEILGLYRVPIPFTNAHFIPLSLPVEMNIQRRVWFSIFLAIAFLLLIVHWFTDLW